LFNDQFFFGEGPQLLETHTFKKNFFHPFFQLGGIFFTAKTPIFLASKTADLSCQSGHQVDHFKGMRLRLGLG